MAASPSALHRARRRHFARWFALDRLPQRLLLSSLSPAQPALPQEVLGATAPSLPPRRPAFHRPTPPAGFSPRIRGPVRAGRQNRMGGAQQASLRRTSARSEVSSSLHPPRGHLQPSPSRSRKRPRQF